ncbi:MAG: ABC transporter substrate-binding protein [Deltaproteobacteria bacterium]|nr:ABC transporter substrate-binding protein [Deltaproteobacteria bacterium]
MKQSKIAVLVLIFFSACVFFSAQDALASPARDQLKLTIDQVLEILQDQSLKGEEHTKARRASLRRVIHERFSFAKMSQLSLARHWRKRSKEEKKIFIGLFGKLLEQTYISKMEAYTSEKVVYVKEFVKKKKAQVYTKIITDSVDIPIDYRMYKTKDGSWMVYDIVIEGVSLVGNYRSQFDQILQKDTYEKLLGELKKKIES